MRGLDFRPLDEAVLRYALGHTGGRGGLLWAKASVLFTQSSVLEGSRHETDRERRGEIIIDLTRDIKQLLQRKNQERKSRSDPNEKEGEQAFKEASRSEERKMEASPTGKTTGSGTGTRVVGSGKKIIT